MGAVTSMQEVDRIRRELREFELKNSKCPVDQRRLQKEAEARAQEAREAQEQQQATNWMAAIDQRIQQNHSYWFGREEEGHRGVILDAIAEFAVRNRREDHKEVERLIEEERQSFDTKLAELEKRLKSVPGKLPVAKSWEPERVTYQRWFATMARPIRRNGIPRKSPAAPTGFASRGVAAMRSRQPPEATMMRMKATLSSTSSSLTALATFKVTSSAQ